MQQTIIAVCGPGIADPDTLAVAEEVGRRIAEAGAALICGGHAGIMEAACKGAAEAGGLTIGVLPGPDRAAANPYVRIPIVTNMGQARNVIIVGTANAIIAISGEYGTLSEIALALKVSTPVVGLDTWQFSKPRGNAPDPVHRAATPEEAVAMAIKLTSRGQ
jgi:uncharacterized protein (TIGR00725 family)